MVNSAVAPVQSSANTRVKWPGLEAHLHPVLSLQFFPSFWYWLPVVALTYVFLQDWQQWWYHHKHIYSTCVRGFSCPGCSALQLFDIPLLHADCIVHSMPLYFCSQQCRLPTRHKYLVSNQTRSFAVCAAVPVRCPIWNCYTWTVDSGILCVELSSDDQGAVP